MPPTLPGGYLFHSATQNRSVMHFKNCNSKSLLELYVPGSTGSVLGSTGRAPGRTGSVPEHAGRVLGRPGTRPGTPRARPGSLERVSGRKGKRPVPPGTRLVCPRTQRVDIGRPWTPAAAVAAAAVAAAAVAAAAAAEYDFVSEADFPKPEPSFPKLRVASVASLPRPLCYSPLPSAPLLLSFFAFSSLVLSLCSPGKKMALKK